MSTPNPIDALIKLPGITDTQRATVNPVDELLATLPGHIRVERPKTLSETFMEGIGAGFLHPVQSFTGTEAGSLDDLSAGEQVAKIGGELLGMGVSFIPFLKGAQLGLKGVGLAARMTPWALRVTEGAVAAGLYEVGAGPLENAPERVATGAAFGIAGEIAFMGAAAAWRNRFPRELPRFVEPEDLPVGRPLPAPVPARPIPVHPDALRVEQYLRPAEGQAVDEIVTRLQGIGDVTKQMEYVAANVARIHRPGGVAIIPGITRPQEFASFLSRELPDVKFSFRPTEGGMYEVLMADAQAQTRLRTVSAKGMRLGEHNLTFEESVDLIMTDVPRERGVPVIRGTQEEVNRLFSELGGSSNSVGGFATYNPESITLVKGTAEFETLVHEYTHVLTGRLASPSSTNRGMLALDEIFRVGPRHSSTNELRLNRASTNLETVRSELERATIEVVRRSVVAVSEKPLADAAIETFVRKNSGYYFRDSELVARMVELMFLSPNAAKRLAPHASRIMARTIKRESPKLQMILGRRELKNIDDVLTDLWISTDDDIFYFRQDPFEVTDKMRRQFAQRGVFEGMEILHEGKRYEVGALVGKNADEIRLRDPQTGQMLDDVVKAADVHRPLFPGIVVRDQKLLSKLTKLHETPPSWVGVMLKDELRGGAGLRAVVEMDDFEFSSSFGRWVRENRELVTRNADPEVMGQLSQGRAQIEDLVGKALAAKGKKGLAINDNGRFMLFVADDGAVKMSDEVLSPALVTGPFDGKALQTPEGRYQLASRWVEVSHRNLSESILRAAGVTDRELPHYLNLDPLAGIAERVMNPEVQAALRTAREAARKRKTTVENTAASYGARIDITSSGDVRVMSDNHVEAARFSTPEEAQRYIERAGPVDLTELDSASSTPTGFVGDAGGTSHAPKPQEQMAPRKFSERLLDSTNLFASMFTALENWAKSAERAGFGPAFTRIFEPAQKAIQQVDWEMAKITRDLLGGRTFNEQMRHVERIARGMDDTQQQNVVRYIEYLSREEVAAPGGLLPRGMTDNEIRVANEIIRVGLADDVPRLLATDRLTSTLLKNRDTFLIKAAEMERMELTPEMAQTVQRLRGLADEISTKEGVYDHLGLSQEERFVLSIIEQGRGSDADRFSIFAVSRYTSAKPQDPRFRTGRDQYAHETRMTARELELAKELDRTYEATFRMSGLSAKQQIGGYWPHMRKFAEYGFNPEADFIRRHLPDSVEWSALRFRTGELDIYSMDPVMTTFKHVRNMLMRQSFDPILPDIKQALKVVKASDERTHRIMSEYIQEIMGKPHASFEKVQQAIAKSAEVLGFKLPDNLVKDTVNTLTALGYGATIPFRPALIVRNYFSIFQMVAPRTGLSQFFDGLRVALTKEGYEEAARAGAITANVAPVFGTSEVFEFGATKLNRRLQRLLEKGFSWYQKADDLGRATAFHAQKRAVQSNMDDLFRGRIDYEEFKVRSKVHTFDGIDIQEFDQLWGAGQYEEAANLLGNRLARESIFRYGHANHPAGWGGIYGRLFGQFGTWPVQYKDYILQGMTRGTTKDRLEFAAIHASINAGTVAAGAAVGMNLQSWVSFPALSYTGGPFADLAISAVQVVGGSEQERALAWRNIMFQVPTLDDPTSIFVPGSYLLGDLMKMGDAGNLVEAGVLGSGFRMLEPKDDVDFSFLFGF